MIPLYIDIHTYSHHQLIIFLQRKAKILPPPILAFPPPINHPTGNPAPRKINTP